MVRIRDVMNTNVVTLDEKTTVKEAVELMGEKHLGSVVVTKEGTPTGIFTERDFLSKVVIDGSAIDKVSVGDYASSPLITVNPDFDMREAAQIMADMRVKRLVVMDKESGELIGIFTASDLAMALASDAR